ncbi:MAG: DUF6240 domain-containing protein, partial [Defluviitaleaceae bacterium]|nr:DUF6240 domain-containing protein [Defluviitaleaceae bacterium]
MTEIKAKAEGTYNPPPPAASLPQMILAAAQEQLALNKMPTHMTQDVMTELLLNAGFKATEENLAMLKMLMDNGLPLTEKNITHMNQALKLTTPRGGKPDPAKALFMVLNNMRLTTANAAQLNALASGQAKITSQIQHLIQAIHQVSDPDLAAQLTRILTVAGEGQSTRQGQAAPQGQIPQQSTAPATTAQNAAPLPPGANPPVAHLP